MCSKQQSKSHSDQPQDHDTIAEECKMSKEEVKEDKGDPENININPPSSPNPLISFITKKVCKLNSFLGSLNLVPQSSDMKFVYTKEDDGDIMFIEIIKKYYDSSEEELGEDENVATGGSEIEYFDIVPTRSELTYHKYLMSGPISSLFLRNPIIVEGCPSNLKIPYNIRHVHVEKAYIDLNSPLNVMTRNFTYVLDFMIVEDISSITDPRLSQVVLGKPFVEISNMTHGLSLGVVKFTNGINEERGGQEKRSRVRDRQDFRFYKECLVLGPEYLTELEDEGGVTLYLMRRSLEVLRSFIGQLLDDDLTRTQFMRMKSLGNRSSFGRNSASVLMEDLDELPFFSLHDIADATDYFSIKNKIGEGGFGAVYKELAYSTAGNDPGRSATILTLVIIRGRAVAKYLQIMFDKEGEHGRWGSKAFQNVLVFSPGSGIVHQIATVVNGRCASLHFFDLVE
ncbi:MAK10-like protein [Tanacetum coccineum]